MQACSDFLRSSYWSRTIPPIKNPVDAAFAIETAWIAYVTNQLQRIQSAQSEFDPTNDQLRVPIDTTKELAVFADRHSLTLEEANWLINKGYNGARHLLQQHLL
jgi:hypothetical protein